MSESIIEAVAPALITGFVTLIGVFMSHRAAVSAVRHDFELRQAVMSAEIAQMKDDLKEHNHYARMFAESMPAAQEQIKAVDRRVTALEKGARA